MVILVQISFYKSQQTWMINIVETLPDFPDIKERVSEKENENICCHEYVVREVSSFRFFLKYFFLKKISQIGKPLASFSLSLMNTNISDTVHSAGFQLDCCYAERYLPAIWVKHSMYHVQGHWSLMNVKIKNKRSKILVWTFSKMGKI